jgi:hypothetical protein
MSDTIFNGRDTLELLEKVAQTLFDRSRQLEQRIAELEQRLLPGDARVVATQGMLMRLIGIITDRGGISREDWNAVVAETLQAIEATRPEAPDAPDRQKIDLLVQEFGRFSVEAAPQPSAVSISIRADAVSPAGSENMPELEGAVQAEDAGQPVSDERLVRWDAYRRGE